MLRDITAAWEGTNGSYLVIVYFVVLTLIGMYIIMSLFIAILLERFSGQDDTKFDMEDQTAEVNYCCCGCIKPLFSFRSAFCVRVLASLSSTGAIPLSNNIQPAPVV